MLFRIHIIAPLLALAACAPSETATQTATAETPVPAALQGRTIGEPVSCVTNRDILDTDVVTDRVILFHMRGGRTYRNDLPMACPQLTRPGSAFSHRSTIAQLCDVDVVEVFDPISRAGFGACQLGKFVPYELPEGVRR